MVETVDETNRFPYVPELSAIVGTLLEEVGLQERSLTIVLIDDERMSLLNGEYRGVDGPTDVLSFPTHEPDDEGVPQVEHLGDILISVDTASRQAREHGHRLLGEVATLAAHGLTHLRGFDHQTEESWQIFREAQERALALARSD